jgi:hypothetical protein
LKTFSGSERSKVIESKELQLTESRGTGIPRIKKVMAANGSPGATFSTDETRNHFLAVLPVHAELPGFGGANDETLHGLNATESAVLGCLQDGPKGRSEIAEFLGVTRSSYTLLIDHQRFHPAASAVNLNKLFHKNCVVAEKLVHYSRRFQRHNSAW